MQQCCLTHLEYPGVLDSPYCLEDHNGPYHQEDQEDLRQAVSIVG